VPEEKILRRFTGVRQEHVPRQGVNQAPKKRRLALCEHALKTLFTMPPL
jgi:hypothetical protein